MAWTGDKNLMTQADADHQRGWRGTVRHFRRVLKRCWLDSSNWNQPRIFCQNAGACGSSYIVQLLVDNGFEKTYHERRPDLLQLGLQHFESRVSRSKLIRMLRYTRHDVWFEANNRLFSLSRELSDAFPAARFIHLLRHPADAVRSAMSRPGVEQYLATSPRFRGSLGGPHSASPFERFCWHWANMNRRIMADLNDVEHTTGQPRLVLRFEDLIAGRVEPLEQFLGQPLSVRSRPPVNQSPVRTAGKFPTYSQWTKCQRERFDQICMPVYSEIMTSGNAFKSAARAA